MVNAGTLSLGRWKAPINDNSTFMVGSYVCGSTSGISSKSALFSLTSQFHGLSIATKVDDLE